MFCENCGAEIKDDSLFCESCGKPVQRQSAAPESARANTWQTSASVPLQQTAVMDAVPQQNVQTKNNKTLIIIIVVGIVAIATAAVVFFVKPNIEKWSKIEDSFTSADLQAEGSKKTDDSSSSKSSGNSSSNSSSSGKTDSKTSTDSSGSSYVIKDSSTRRLSESEVSSFSDDQISIAQNEIWARHGRKFKNNWLQTYFNKQSWYTGTIEADNFLNEYTPTEIEDYNSKLLNDILTKRGYSLEKAHPN